MPKFEILVALFSGFRSGCHEFESHPPRVDKLHGDNIPMFVPKLGLFKPGQTYVCPQLGAFCMKILLSLILRLWENGRQLCP